VDRADRFRPSALRDREQQLVSIYNTVQDVIFYLSAEPEGRFRFISVNATFLRVTGLNPDAVVGKTVNELIPEPSLTMALERFAFRAPGKLVRVLNRHTAAYAPSTNDQEAALLAREFIRWRKQVKTLDSISITGLALPVPIWLDRFTISPSGDTPNPHGARARSDSER
jgi:PAS domain-containing protein